MDRERWTLIENIYHSALPRPDSERASYLEEACKGDEDLHREVESLLASERKAEGFIESPAVQVAAQLLTSQEIKKDGAVPLSSGTVLSHYRIIEKIGAGGMGEVYRAHDPRLGRDVAIKILPGAFASDPDRLRRFEQEARAAAALNHPNIMAIYDVGTWEYGTPYVVSELLEGETLRACLQRGPLPVRKAVDLAMQACLGLAAAHDKGIIHRDLKPENIWLTKDGHLKILDFGLAKLLPEKVASANAELANVIHTDSTRVMGTLGYVSPEQVSGQTVDQRSDIFSLGALMYEMLSGQRAFRGATPADTIGAILRLDPTLLSAGNPAIPQAVSGIVHRALEKDPNDRFHSAKDVAFALAAASDPHSPDAKASVGPVLLGKKSALIAAALVLTLGLLWLWNPGGFHSISRSSPARASIRSLAVLPLENVSGGADQDYFADGMTDELITQLAGLNDVRVISRGSALQFRGSKLLVSEIAAKLNVDAVIEGSVLRQGNRVRITARLVQAATDHHLWAHSYDGDIGDAIRLQNEVALSVAEEIKAKLRPEDQQRLAGSTHSVSPEAYDAYLKGLYYSAKLTPDDLQRGFEFFQHAIDADPAFAPAYAGLAEAYSWATGLSMLSTQEAMPKAELAARKAIELDPNLAMAHHSLAWAHYALRWDFPAAEKEFQRAIELSPNNATAHLWYGMYLSQRKRTEEAAAEMQKAKQLDPLSSIVNGLSLTPLLASRQYEKLIDEITQGLKSSPNDSLLNWLLTSAYEQKGDIRNAINQQEKQSIIYGEDATKAAQEFSALRRAFSAGSERAYWASREKVLSAPGTDPYTLAVVQAHLGKADAMYSSLANAYKQRSTELLYWISIEPAFDRFRSDRQFRGLLQNMGLPG